MLTQSRRATPVSGARVRQRGTGRLRRGAAPAGAVMAAGMLVLAGCGSSTGDGQTGAEDTTASAGAQTSGQTGQTEQAGQAGQSGQAGQAGTTTVTGVFESPADASDAFTYDTEEVPAGSAEATVSVDEQDSQTTVDLDVTGLLPDHEFGAHAHQNQCGMDPKDSGPHYQNVPDPEATSDDPSSDPQYANPDNELWLDFTTDAEGAAQVESTQDWTFRPGEAQSVVIHQHHTATGPDDSGEAGDRVACINVDF